MQVLTAYDLVPTPRQYGQIPRTVRPDRQHSSLSLCGVGGSRQRSPWNDLPSPERRGCHKKMMNGQRLVSSLPPLEHGVGMFFYFSAFCDQFCAASLKLCCRITQSRTTNYAQLPFGVFDQAHGGSVCSRYRDFSFPGFHFFLLALVGFPSLLLRIYAICVLMSNIIYALCVFFFNRLENRQGAAELYNAKVETRAVA